MANNLNGKCAKCGLSPHDDQDIKLHRFPKPESTNMRRCELWAKYCFPDKPWSSLEFQHKLYLENYMLCNNHFKYSDYININENQLSEHAAPMTDIDKRRDAFKMHGTKEPAPRPSQHRDASEMHSTKEPAAGPSQHRDASEMHGTTEPAPGPSQHRDASKMHGTEEPAPGPSKHRDASEMHSTKEPAPGPSKHRDAYEMHSIEEPAPGPSKHRDASEMHSSEEPAPGPSQHRDASEMHSTKEPAPRPSKHRGASGMRRRKKPAPGPSKFVSSVTRKLLQKPKYIIRSRKCKTHKKKLCQLCNNRSKQLKRDVLKIITEHISVKLLMKKLRPSFGFVLQPQSSKVKRIVTARNWTTEEKTIALRFHKRYPSTYRLLQELWCMPEISILNTLNKLLRKFPLFNGINNNIFASLKKRVIAQTPFENEYILMFDEIPVRPNVSYRIEVNSIEGEDYGCVGRSAIVTEYVLVFMVTDLRKKFKHPIAYYLAGTYMTPAKLATHIREVLKKCFEIGMSIPAIVCDVDGVHRDALNKLGASKDHPYFNVYKHVVVSIFDPPHLLRSFRNSFLKYNLRSITNHMACGNSQEGIAKWSHLQDFYEIDKNCEGAVFAPALSDDHLNPNRNQKMKTNLAAEVLSHRVGVGILAKVSEGKLSPETQATADVVFFMDRLFDAINTDTTGRGRMPYFTNMTTRSPRLKHFEAMKTFFEDLEFVGCEDSPPSKDGWVWTLNGIIEVFKILKRKHGIQSLPRRLFRLEPLENLRSTIQANCDATEDSKLSISEFIFELKIIVMTEMDLLV